MATVTKKSHSIDSDIYSQIEAIASKEGITASALLAEGARMVISTRRGLKGVAEWESLNGRLSEKELAEADAALDKVGVPGE